VKSFKTKEFVNPKQVPLKIARVGNEEHGYRLIIATRKSFVELILDDEKLKKYQEETKPTEKVKSSKNKGEPTLEIAKIIKIQKNYEFVQFINIGNDQTAVMINNPETNQIRYILISVDESYEKPDKLNSKKSSKDKEDDEENDKEVGKANDKGVNEVEGLPTDGNTTNNATDKEADDSESQQQEN